ncbi:hypothetical protein BD289DRAFT_110216 [Coniella lustricola]|uniref:Uncharacterized protein n=1 Tax=Coniella lustricola TaxID=2025994 RepID=A0A2T2ZXC5_9PEZI|nr:hypothetical protein BD289DRAFT_110216 [Coniella lustricola]
MNASTGCGLLPGELLQGKSLLMLSRQVPSHVHMANDVLYGTETWRCTDAGPTYDPTDGSEKTRRRPITGRSLDIFFSSFAYGDQEALTVGIGKKNGEVVEMALLLLARWLALGLLHAGISQNINVACPWVSLKQQKSWQLEKDTRTCGVH